MTEHVLDRIRALPPTTDPDALRLLLGDAAVAIRLLQHRLDLAETLVEQLREGR